MSITLKYLWDLALRSFVKPREAVREVLALQAPREAWFLGLALAVIMSLLMTYIGELILLSSVRDGDASSDSAQGDSLYALPPLALAFVAGVMTLVAAWFLFFVGRIFNGSGDFEGALRLVVWLQALMLLVQGVQLFTVLVIPSLVGLVFFASYVLILWLLTAFTAELHGFKALFPVFVVIFFSLMTLGFIILMVLQVLGLMSPLEAANV